MFIQIIESPVGDPEGMRAHFFDGVERLHHPTPRGYLGATSGITPDGRWVNVIRFESEQAAQQNSARPEVGQWWEEGERFRKGDASFLDSTDTATFLAGMSDRSGFVQLLQATVADRGRFEALLARLEATLPGHRPDLIGGLVVWHGDRVTMINSFSTEAQARMGERSVKPAPVAALVDEWRALLSDVRFLDLPEPWHV